MKKYLFTIAIVATLSGCATLEKTGQSIGNWWNRPATQEAVIKAQQIAFSFAMNAGLQALRTYATGESIDYREVIIQSGAATLYQQASNIRQLQGTAQVLDPNATAALLAAGGTNKEISQALAQQLFNNASALISAGLTPNQAAEVNAAGLDAAAQLLVIQK